MDADVSLVFEEAKYGVGHGIVIGSRDAERARANGAEVGAAGAANEDAVRGVDLVVLAGFMHLLTPAFLERFRERIVNVHPSLLPAFPGAHAVEEQLAAGVAESGATVHLVDEGVDSGPILRQERVPVVADDTPATLHERIKQVEHRLLPEVVGELCAR